MHHPIFQGSSAFVARAVFPALIGVLWGYSVHFLLFVLLHWYYEPRAPLADEQLARYRDLFISMSLTAIVVGMGLAALAARRNKGIMLLAVALGLACAVALLSPYATVLDALFNAEGLDGA